MSDLKALGRVLRAQSRDLGGGERGGFDRVMVTQGFY